MPPSLLPPALASRLSSFSLAPAPTPEELEQFERGLPHPLPADFREFLLQFHCALLHDCSTGFRDAVEREVRTSHILGLSEFEHGGAEIPSDVLVFASQRGSINRFGIQLADRRDSPRGTVWFFDSNAPSETEDLYVARECAPSFSAFLAQLTPHPEDPVDPVAPVSQAAPDDPNDPWLHPEALEKVPADLPTPEKPLVLAGHGHAIGGARLEVYVDTWVPDLEARKYGYEPDRATVRYSLEVHAAESSGEDGAPEPYASTLPVAEANGGRHPSLVEWSTLVLGPEGDWDAWYGNDAPSLQDNRLTVLERSGADLKVRWEASYSQYGRDFAFLFEGPVHFEGIRFDVKDPADVDRVLASAFGGAHRPEEWTRTVGERQDRGEHVSEDRRYRFPVTLVPA
ncbi:SMI1/KNR4 family protein [Pyxidicoccus xibeiensis]|uniref:SMI1/KNR4 family protein n=1 Tax=Pyxidicoccus xibeiensis TaxID=2906759 RepID=UPI0020A7669E|nr:SMI1/KNR4 family protein [Pyxidicoccus xibeiensis]MCP3140859.1 SMI1/KNR4 family protein [Pyxidicoccus xibeiensis]